MKKFWAIKAVLIVLLVIPNFVYSASLVALDGGNQTLFLVNTVNGNTEKLMNLPYFTFGGIDYDNSGQLFAMIDTGSIHAKFYRLDPILNSATEIRSYSKDFESFKIIDGKGFALNIFARSTSDLSFFS